MAALGIPFLIQVSEFIVCTVQVGVGLHVHMHKPNWVIMKSYFYHILADPVLLEMTVQYLQEKIQDMESVQKTILVRLENIEQHVRGRDTEKQTGHARTHEDSWHHLDDAFDDSEYWQSHAYYSSACPPLPYAQSTQPQYVPLLTNAQAQLYLSWCEHSPSVRLSHHEHSTSVSFPS